MLAILWFPQDKLLSHPRAVWDAGLSGGVHLGSVNPEGVMARKQYRPGLTPAPVPSAQTAYLRVARTVQCFASRMVACGVPRPALSTSPRNTSRASPLH